MKHVLPKVWTYSREVLERMYKRDLSFASGKIDFKEVRKAGMFSEVTEMDYICSSPS